ncbi:MAG: hypothetical protein JXB38_21815 [Anaerolineales bacterium]|nr:hypothetical protein [Anaerolineales bacterium]
MPLEELIPQLEFAQNAALLLGAGISYDWGIPIGYRLPMNFGKHNPKLLHKHHLYDLWETANTRAAEERYTKALVNAFRSSEVLQSALLQWMNKQPAMLGYNPEIKSKQPDDHLIFDIAWLKGIFNHLITTNWDFILESYLYYIYWEAYANPFMPTHLQLNNGVEIEIDYALLFFNDLLNETETEDELMSTPRWDIIARDVDLPRQKAELHPLWKIHGSPFFLACPLCSGVNRWKLEIDKLDIGDPCPSHPDHTLGPEIVFWDEQIDHAPRQVWEALQAELSKTDIVVVCGFSGSGGDEYIRSVLESHPNTWLVNPDIGAWNPKSINYIKGTGTDLAKALSPLL